MLKIEKEEEPARQIRSVRSSGRMNVGEGRREPKGEIEGRDRVEASFARRFRTRGKKRARIIVRKGLIILMRSRGERVFPRKGRRTATEKKKPLGTGQLHRSSRGGEKRRRREGAMTSQEGRVW